MELAEAGSKNSKISCAYHAEYLFDVHSNHSGEWQSDVKDLTLAFSKTVCCGDVEYHVRLD